ncbi:MAG: hypothetical protein P4M11_12060 [Candidatus Pacebacteria bacterium]|nr:hypothetical protein [Candidatus Paceibacterota bacterium]
MTFFFVAKTFCDAAFTYSMAMCQPLGTAQGGSFILNDLKNLLRPIFEGVFIYFFLSLAMV